MINDAVPLPPQAAERYETTRLLGEGGMGTVYLAQDKVLDRTVALKIVRLDRADRARDQRRFRREISLLARVSNAHVVRLLDYEEHEDTLCYTMEYVEGASLGDLAEDGSFSVDEAVGIAAQLSDGVAAVHEAGVLHRDIKLDNMVITYDGSLKLVDFGLAILDDEEVTRLTREGHVIGTVGYIAPELVLTGEACEQSDVYQIGVVLYRLLTNTMPIPEDKYFSIMAGRTDYEIKSPSALRADIDPTLENIIERSLALDVNVRQESATVLCDELSRWLRTNAQERWQTVSRTLTRYEKKSTPWQYFVLPLFLLFLLLLVLFCGPRNQSPRTTRAVPSVKATKSAPPGRDEMGRTSLHWAAQKARVGKVKSLIAKGVAVEPVDVGGRTPLHLAAMAGSEPVASALLWAGAVVDRRDGQGNTPLHYGASSGDLVLIRQLVRHGANVSVRGKDGHTPLHLAAANGDIDMFADLIRLRADPKVKNDNGETPFQLAKRLGHKAISSGKRITDIMALSLIKDHSPFYRAVTNNDTALVRLLLSKGADANEKLEGNSRPLHFAVKSRNRAMVVFLIEGGARLDLLDDKGMAPLHYAASAGNESLVRILLAKGADRTVITSKGLRPADLAKQNGHSAVAALLGF